MREIKTFAKRKITKSSDEVARKYFLVYEGKETELKYFEAVNDLRREIGINPLIELCPLIRSYSENGWSNPKKILERVMLNLEESKTGKLTYETLLNRIMDYLHSEGAISQGSNQPHNVWRILKWYCEKKLSVQLDDIVCDIENDCEKLCSCLKERANIFSIVTNISDIIKNQNITYDEHFDKICLIVDRDRSSFISKPENNQYEYVLNTCEKEKFGFYLTNPCFEFWLLLHFDEVRSIDKRKMLENEKVSRKRTYAAEELHKLMPHYKKTNYDARMLAKRIDRAIINEKYFCEDIKMLEHKIGSNIGLLIEELRKQ